VPDATPTPTPTTINEPEQNLEDVLNGGLGSTDYDCDGLRNIKDNCPLVYNPDQKDKDRDGTGDACDPDLKGSKTKDSRCDQDCDRVFDVKDNCPLVYNPDQKDKDSNGIGDACDPQLVAPGTMKEGCPEGKTQRRKKPRETTAHPTNAGQ
jgi:hypothetical protein